MKNKKIKNTINDYILTIINSYLAGFMIGLGGLIYLSIDNKIIGSLLFSFGLITILSKTYYLYTGRIADISTKTLISDVCYYTTMLIFNFIGASTVGWFAQELGLKTTTLIENKLTLSNRHIFIASIICGVLMYLGVSLSKIKENNIYATLAVMIFILTGAEHCVANAFYFAVDNCLLQNWHFFIINILGNSIGAILWKHLENIPKKLRWNF